jgi:serine/threonine-protein kinase
LRGKYRLDAVLGVGGMAVVFAVTHRNGRRFALKMLHAELSVRADLRKRFLREGYIANAVGHTGAVAVLDDDVAEDGSAFLVMELLDGEGLDGLMTRHAEGIPVTAALSLAYQLLDVLAAAHAKNVVHRDIKPGNLFATRKGELKVLDFGIARLQEPEGRATTRTGMTMGTPAFMAPEQAMGKPIDARADLFSVGATLFTLLSGRFVHQGDTGQELMVKAATEPAPPLASIAPHVPSVVSACVDRALAFGLTERWQSAEMMQAAVADAFQTLFGGEVSAKPLAAIVTRSHAGEIYASAPEAPPPGAPIESPPPPPPPHVATMALPGAPGRPSSSDAQVFLAASSGSSPEAKVSPITGEPVSATQRRSAPGVTPPPAASRRPVLIAALSAAGLTTLAAIAVVLGLRSTPRQEGAPTLPPSSAAAPVTAAAPLPGTVETVAPLEAPSARFPSSPSSPSAAADEHEAPTTSAARATVRAPATTPVRSADAGARRGEPTPKVDPWATQ